MVYEWGRKSWDVDPNVVGKAIEKIADREGAATSEGILKVARRPSSQLHGLFEWDNEHAAELYRRRQACDVTSSLVVVYEDEEKEAHRLPAFFHVDYAEESEPGEQPERMVGYQSIAVVKANPNSQRSAAEELLANLEGLRRRHEALDLFESVWREVERVKEKVMSN